MVRVLTYTSCANTDEVFVYIDDNTEAVSSDYVLKTRDSVGHLVVKIELVALQEADLKAGIHFLTISATVKTVRTCDTYTGTGEIYIIEKEEAKGN